MNAVLAFIAMLLWSGVSLAAIDDFKVIKLEQDVRRLEQQVRELSRQVAELRREPALSADQIQPPNRAPAPAVGSASWLQAKSWQSLRVGMDELQVIQTLGPPTSTRIAADGDTRILLYALELVGGSFLGGSVELRDRRVVAINEPVLK
jgi:hypothetical protein